MMTCPPTWPTLYYKDNYPALQRVKARWGPAQRLQPHAVHRPRHLG